MHRIHLLPLAGLLVWVGCGDASRDDGRAAGAPRWSPRPMPSGAAPPLQVTLTPDADSVLIRDAASQALRGVIRSVADSIDRPGVCALSAAGAGALARLRHAFPIDTTVPWLAVTRLETETLLGTRSLLPGARAVYLFEGVLRGSRRRISLQWPVVSARAVPADAPVTALEQAIIPTAAELDALVLSLSETGSWKQTAAPQAGDPDPAMATPLVGDLPLHAVLLERPCTRITLSLPVIARVDKVLRIPVRQGDTVTALARVAEGTVRVAFDEAPLPAEPKERRSIPGARVVAAADGRVTLRIRVQVVPRAQATGQLVTLLLDRQSPR